MIDTSAIQRLRQSVRKWRWSRSVPLTSRRDLIALGTTYGRWFVPSSILSKTSTCYCVGVGEDITFDLALIDRFGCVVQAFDPTPRSEAYVKEHAAHESRFVFHPYGLWSDDTVLKFYAPKNPDHVSHSAVNLQDTDTYFEASVKSLSTMMADLGHHSLDLLKIDIEGAEYEVLGWLLSSNIRPSILCVEFDQPVPLGKPVEMVNLLGTAGYEPVVRDGWNVTFVFNASSAKQNP